MEDFSLMDYGTISKIEKARRYAEEPERITFNNLSVEFKGDNNTYAITVDEHGWHCSCPGFHAHHICPHIMSLERIFSKMLKRDPLPYAQGQNVVSDVEKAKRYSEEKDRIHFITFDVTFKGNNSDHQTVYGHEGWDCDCSDFRRAGNCCHTMALERILKNMLPVAAQGGG
jgi:hypothetical protein